MFLHLFFSISLLPIPIETCLRTIPRDEYYPTATLPPSKTPLRVLPVLTTTTASTTTTSTITTPTTTSSTTPAPTSTVTLTSIAGVTVTTASTTTVNPCTTCDISTITPTGLPAGESFGSSELAASGSCKVTQVECQKDNGIACTTVSIKSGSTTLLSGSNVAQVTADLTCQSTALYSYMAVSQVGQLSCEFTGCPSCTTCDLNTIAPTGLPTGGVFESMDSTDATGCKQSTITCKRTDNQVCTSVTISSGTTTIATSTGTDTFVTTTLSCAADGTWSSGATTNLGQLTCNFNCMPPPPCTTCDMTKLASTNVPAGYSIIIENSVLGGCKHTAVTCKRNAGGPCKSVILSFQSNLGYLPVSGVASTGMVKVDFQCQNDGTYTFFFFSKINMVMCSFNC